MQSFFPRDVFGEMWDLIESVPEELLCNTYSYNGRADVLNDIDNVVHKIGGYIYIPPVHAYYFKNYLH